MIWRTSVRALPIAAAPPYAAARLPLLFFCAVCYRCGYELRLRLAFESTLGAGTQDILIELYGFIGACERIDLHSLTYTVSCKSRCITDRPVWSIVLI